MNSFSTETESLKPLYMSQTEANAVMELWARRQQEESARQSMVTVHDVAEATQLSQSEVEKLLSEIRSRHSDSAGERSRFQRSDQSLERDPNERSLVASYRLVRPYLALTSGFLCIWVKFLVEEWARDTNYSKHFHDLEVLEVMFGAYSFIAFISIFFFPVLKQLGSSSIVTFFRQAIKSAFANS